MQIFTHLTVVVCILIIILTTGLLSWIFTHSINIVSSAPKIVDFDGNKRITDFLLFELLVSVNTAIKQRSHVNKYHYKFEDNVGKNTLLLKVAIVIQSYM